MTRPAWLVTVGNSGGSTTRHVGGLQSQTVSATNGDVGSNRRGRHGQAGENSLSGLRGLVMAPTERSLPQSSQSAGRGLHRTVPAWQIARRASDGDRADERSLPPGSQSVGRGVQLAEREGVRCRTACRVEGLQQESAARATGIAGTVVRSITGDGTGALPQRDSVQVADLRPASRPDTSSASPPRIAGSSRRRSGSAASASSRPRSRPRHLSPSPRRATAAAELPGILRRRRRSTSPDESDSWASLAAASSMFFSEYESFPRAASTRVSSWHIAMGSIALPAEDSRGDWAASMCSTASHRGKATAPRGRATCQRLGPDTAQASRTIGRSRRVSSTPPTASSRWRRCFAGRSSAGHNQRWDRM